MSFSTIAAANLADRTMGILGKRGEELSRTQLKGVSEQTFRMLDDQIKMSGSVSRDELAKAFGGINDAGADKLDRALSRAQATPWHRKFFLGEHKITVQSALDAIFKPAKPAVGG